MTGSSDTEFTGKRALVTGGAKGMGKPSSHASEVREPRWSPRLDPLPSTCFSRICSWKPTSDFEGWKPVTHECDCRKIAQLRVPRSSLGPPRKRLSAAC